MDPSAAAPSPPPHRRLAIALPPGPLGISIIRRSTDGECLIVSSKEVKPPSPPSASAPASASASASSALKLEKGDVIWSLNGIRLTTVEGGIKAWVALFETFGRLGMRNLVVLRPTATTDADGVALSSKSKQGPAVAATVTPFAATTPAVKGNNSASRKRDASSAVDAIANNRAAAVPSPQANAGKNNERACFEPMNRSVVVPTQQPTTEPVRKKPKTAVVGARSYTNRDIESLVADSQLANVQAAIVNIWAANNSNSGIATMKSNKPLDDFLTNYDTTSCCFLCKRRFRHNSPHLDILSNGDVSLCSSCENKNTKYTLTEVTEHFGISKGDAKQLSHSTGISGWGGIKYSFSNDTVIEAIRYDESLQRKVRKEAFFKKNYICMKFTKERFHEAGTSSEGKREILKKVVTNVSEVKLRDFAVKSLKKVPKSEVGHFLAKLL